MHVVRLLAPAIEGESHNKDTDFGASGLQIRREAGYAHARQALERKPWERDFDPLGGFVLDEIPSFPLTNWRNARIEERILCAFCPDAPRDRSAFQSASRPLQRISLQSLARAAPPAQPRSKRQARCLFRARVDCHPTATRASTVTT